MRTSFLDEFLSHRMEWMRSAGRWRTCLDPLHERNQRQAKGVMCPFRYTRDRYISLHAQLSPTTGCHDTAALHMTRRRPRDGIVSSGRADNAFGIHPMTFRQWERYGATFQLPGLVPLLEMAPVSWRSSKPRRFAAALWADQKRIPEYEKRWASHHRALRQTEIGGTAIPWTEEDRSCGVPLPGHEIRNVGRTIR
jgi:hypothetical protein